MSLLLLLAAGGAGAAIAAWGGWRGGMAARAGAVAGEIALLVVFVVALAMDAPRVVDGGGTAPGTAGLFDDRLVPTAYLRLVVALWALDSILLVTIAWLLGGLAALRGLLATTLAAITAGAVAFGAAGLVLGVAAASATGLAAALVVLAADHRAVIPTAAREARVSLLAGALLLGGLAIAPVAAALALGTGAGIVEGAGSAPSAVDEAGAVVGLTALVIVAGVAMRIGAIPFHLRVPRLADVVPPIALPLLLAWIPLPLAAVGLAASDGLVAPLALPLGGERGIIVGVALFTMAAAALAAFIQDDIRHSVGYLVIADGGLVLLAFAALDPAAWGPARTWLVALAASKTALGAWAAVAEPRFGTRSLPDLRGWVPRAPMLAAALVLAILATYGLPGWVAFGARGDLARLAAGAPWDAVLLLAGFLTLPAYLRILAIGTGSASSAVARAAPERIMRYRRSAGTPVVEPEGPARAGSVDASDGPTTTDAGAAPGTDVPSTAGSPADAAVSDDRAAARRSRERSSLARVASAGTAATVALGSMRDRLSRPSTGAGSIGSRVREALARDRAELLSAAVLTLAVLAALTSWGALDLGGAAGEPAPIVRGPASD